jgi:hypothetical protein
MTPRIGIAALVASFLLGMASSSARAIALNQVDDFQDGTLKGWTGGSSPTNVATGGPAGAGDRYLRISANGSNLGSFNNVQWAGDYSAATVGKIEMNLDNFGPNPVSLRVTLFTPGCSSGPGTCTAWTSTTATTIAAGSGWVTASFSLAEADLTQVFGSGTYAASISNVERVLIRHDDGAPSPPGTTAPVTATLGIDNVKALPEPSTLFGVITGAALLAGSHRRKRVPRP